MSGSETAFTAVGAVGFLVLLVSLVLGEFFEHEFETDHDIDAGPEAEHEAPQEAETPTDLAAPSWYSVKVFAAALVGFGAFGFVSSNLGLPWFLSYAIAAAGFMLVGWATFRYVLVPLAAQQYNSMMSSYSHVNRDALVTLEIPPGRLGRVTFTDRRGARASTDAWSDSHELVPLGSTVTIVGLGKDATPAKSGVIVHYNPFVN